MSERPRDEREFKAELAIKTPGWLPGVTAGVDFRRLWDKRRAEELLSSASVAANIAEDELMTRLESGDQITEVFAAATENYIKNGSKFVRDAFAALLAAALLDDAKVDSLAYLMTRLKDLEPVHIRIIANLPDTRTQLNIDDIAKRCGAHEGIIHDALKRLAEVGFVRYEDREGSTNRARSWGIESSASDYWETEPVGRAAFVAIREAQQLLG